MAEVIRCWWTLARKRAFQPRNGPPLSLYAQPLGGRMVRTKKRPVLDEVLDVGIWWPQKKFIWIKGVEVEDFKMWMFSYNNVINVTLCARSGNTKPASWACTKFRQLRLLTWIEVISLDVWQQEVEFFFPWTDVEVLMTSPWKSRCWMCFAFVLFFFFCSCFTRQLFCIILLCFPFIT